MIREIAIFFVGYAVGLALFLFLATAVLCLGDPKFDHGCGGFDVYYALWFIFYLPVALSASGVAWFRAGSVSAARRRGLASTYLMIVLGGAAASFLADAKWPYLLIEYLGATMCFLLLRKIIYSRDAVSGVNNGVRPGHEA